MLEDVEKVKNHEKQSDGHQDACENEGRVQTISTSNWRKNWRLSKIHDFRFLIAITQRSKIQEHWYIERRLRGTTYQTKISES